MDRQIVYPDQIPDDTDILSTNKNAMVGLGRALQDILGTSTVVAGLACTQTTVASLAVLVGAGAIYSLQNIDGTAYGSLPADNTNTIIKQGIQFGGVTIPTAAPPTSGQSINYLIEASYQDSDTNPVVLQFYNSTPPNTPLVGPGGLGAPSNTQRKGTVVVQAKAGTAATTGTQTTPSPDSGFIGLYVVTVANGQSTVTSTNITTLPTAPFLASNLGNPPVSHISTNLPLTSTTFVNTGLGFTLPVGNYSVEILLNLNGTTTGTQGLKLNTTGGTAVLGNFALGSVVGSVNGSAINTTTAGNASFATISVSTTVDMVIIKIPLQVTQAGTFILQAAQNSSSANATNLLNGCYMKAEKV